MNRIHDAQNPSRAVLALFQEEGRRGLNFSVYDADEMFHVFNWIYPDRPDSALAAYFSSGRAIWRTATSVLRWRFGELGAVHSFLDFASGFGRSTRFTILDLPPERVWAAEIQADALEALRTELGVHVLASREDPARFAPGRSFDAILVSSLFTHLPEARFGQWLSRLASCLEPRGVLMISTHDLGMADRPAPPSGFLFEDRSESGRLAPSQYGSTFVSEDYVGRALSGACPGWPWRRFPRGLVAEHDLYVVVPDRDCDLAALALPRTLDHSVDYLDVDLAGGLQCIGWLADREQGKTPVQVELSVTDGISSASGRAPVEPSKPLPTIRGESIPCWRYRVALRLPTNWDPAAQIELACAFADASRATVWASTLSDALLRSARMQLLYLAEVHAQAATRAESTEPRESRQEEPAPRAPNGWLRAAWRRVTRARRRNRAQISPP